MPIELALRTDDAGQLTATLDGLALPVSTPLSSLPRLPALQADPYTQGRALYAALGGEAMRACLDVESDRCLLLDADDRAAALPWEYAVLPGSRFLACDYPATLSTLDILRAEAGGAVNSSTARANAVSGVVRLVTGADPEQGRRDLALGLDQALQCDPATYAIVMSLQ